MKLRYRAGSLELMSSDLPTKSSSLLRAEEALSARYDCSSSWVLGVHVAGDLDDKLILALEVVIDIAHGAAGGLRDLLHGHIFKAVPVKQVQRHVLDAGAHLQCLPFAGGQRFFHTFSFGNFLLSYQLFYLRSRRQEGTDVDKDR